MVGGQQTDKKTGGTSALLAVVFADLVAYSRNLVERQSETLAFLEESFGQIGTWCETHHGDLIKTTGDGTLAVFPTASDAVEFAVHAQKELKARQHGQPDPFLFRFGIDLGDVIRRDGDVYGNAVNVASRLEAEADPGGVCVSQQVVTSSTGSDSYEFELIGERRLKNIRHPVLTYRAVELTTKTDSRLNSQPLEIRTVGGLRVVGPQFTVPLPRSKRLKAVIGYLALSPDTEGSVDALGAVFWPSVSTESARRSVRNALRNLKNTLGSAVEVADSHIGIDPAQARADLHRIEENIRRGRLDPVLTQERRWIDSILIGLEETSPVFAAWIAVAREDWRNAIASTLESSIRTFEMPDEMGLRPVAEALLRLEPAHEHAARLLISHHVSSGNHGAARRVYDSLKTELEDRYGISPQAETTEALQSPTQKLAQDNGFSAAREIRIQVRQFSAGSDSALDILGVFRTELISGLACFRGWSVVEGEQSPLHGSANTDYALVGEGWAQGDQVNLHVALRDVGTDRVIWATQLAIDPQNFFGAQREVIGKIAASLEVYLVTDRNVAGRDEDAGLVDLWLRGERLITRWTPESHDEAAGIFSQIIEQDPKFAPAYASLASILNVRHVVQPGMPRDALESQKAHQLAERAVELDPLDARNHLAFGWSASLEGKFQKAMIHMDMAARLNPHSPRTLISCAMGFAFFGQVDRALDVLGHSLKCAPVLLDYQWSYAASVYFLAGDYSEAVAAAERSGDRIVDTPGWHAAALAMLGDDRAGESYHRLVEDVSAIWRGVHPPSAQDVINWFTDIYPLSKPDDRRLLQSALHKAAGE